MNKLLFIAVLTISGTFITNAQDQGEFEFGGGFGLNISNVSTADGQDSTSSLISFNAGVSGEYYFSESWGAKIKLIYDSKGWADGFVNNEDTGENLNTNFKLTYVTLPIMANWHFGSNFNWYLNFGPYIGFLVNAEDSELGMDFKNAFNSTDFGIALGIGYKFEIDDDIKLYIEYDAQSGLSDVFKIEAGETIRNGTSSINIGALFIL